MEGRNWERGDAEKREEDRDKRTRRIERRHYLRSPTLCAGQDVAQEDEEVGEGLMTRDGGVVECTEDEGVMNIRQRGSRGA